jgi:hypothetical protein
MILSVLLMVSEEMRENSKTETHPLSSSVFRLLLRMKMLWIVLGLAWHLL